MTVAAAFQPVLTENAEVLQVLFNVERFTDECAERKAQNEQHGVLGGEFAVLNGQQRADRAADADEHRAQANALHDGFLKAFGKAVFEQHSDGGARENGAAVYDGSESDHWLLPSCSER